jgi:hypothetical protein
MFFVIMRQFWGKPIAFTRKNRLLLCGAPSTYRLASSLDPLFLFRFRWNQNRVAHAV